MGLTVVKKIVKKTMSRYMLPTQVTYVMLYLIVHVWRLSVFSDAGTAGRKIVLHIGKTLATRCKHLRTYPTHSTSMLHPMDVEIYRD